MEVKQSTTYLDTEPTTWNGKKAFESWRRFISDLPNQKWNQYRNINTNLKSNPAFIIQIQSKPKGEDFSSCKINIIYNTFECIIFINIIL